MSKEIKKVSINKFESALDKENVITDTLLGTDDVTIQIKKTIPLQEMLLFVQEVVEACVDNENGEHIPEAYDFAIRVATLTHYANLSMPTNLEKQYWLVYNTKAFEQVLTHINTRQFDDIIRAIDKKIKFMLDVISSSAVIKINDVVSKFNDIAETSEKVFSGVNAEDMMKIIQGVSKLGEIEEENVVKTILDVQKSREDKDE